MEIIRFIKWGIAKLELWQWAFILSGLLSIFSLLAPQPWNNYMNGFSLGIVFTFFFKWAIIDSIRSSWHKYREERNKLFGVIKDSEC